MAVAPIQQAPKDVEEEQQQRAGEATGEKWASPRSVVERPSCCQLLLELYLPVLLFVLVPDLVLVFVYSAVLKGPDVYGMVANGDANFIGNMIALGSAMWLALLYVFDFFDSAVRRLPVQLVGFLVLVAMLLGSFTMKAASYPWVPMLLCMCFTVLGLAIKRDQWREETVSLKHFYWSVCASYCICAALVLVIWLLWIFRGESHELWWNAETRAWLASKNTKVYKYVYNGYLRPHGHLEYAVHCDKDTKELEGFSNAVQNDIASACSKAATVWFLQWSGPFLVFMCNILSAGFCMLFSSTLGEMRAQVEEARKKALVTFMKRYVLIIALAVAFMYSSLYVSGAAVKLGSAMLAVAALCAFVMFLWLVKEVDTELLNKMKGEVPMMQNIIAILQSNWVRAVAVGGLNIFIPLLALLDRVRQKIRLCTGVYSTGAYRAKPDEAEDAKKHMYTPQGKRLHDSLALWDWTVILGKVCVLGELFVLLLVGMKVTFVFFSFLNEELKKAELGILAVSAMVFVIGVSMFMLPIVPGSAVYLFAGVVLGFQSQLPDSVGIWAGLGIACVVATVAKLLACIGQYLLGYAAGKSVKVQQFVGVDKVPTRAMEHVLKQPGFDLFKVCILVAGPDFPTSMLCGILKLHIPQMLLGTSPVIIVSIIPQTLVGVLLTKEGATEGVWGMISTVATGIAAAVQAGATLVFSYGIMKTVEERGEQLRNQHRPEHEAVARLTEREAEYIAKYKEVSEWSQLRSGPRAALLVAVGMFLVSGFIMAVDFTAGASEKICFLKFAITDKIWKPYDLGGLNNNALNLVRPLGWACLGLAVVAFALHVAFGKWLAAKARRALAQQTPAGPVLADDAVGMAAKRTQG